MHLGAPRILLGRSMQVGSLGSCSWQMQAPAGSRASCDLHLIFPSLHMIMWAPSHHRRGLLPEADHMLLGARGGSCYAVQRFKWCSYKAFSWWQLKIDSFHPDSKFWVNPGCSAWHWEAFALNSQVVCFCVSVRVLLFLFDFWSLKEDKQTSK